MIELIYYYYLVLLSRVNLSIDRDNEDEENEISEDITGRIGKGLLSPHRRRRPMPARSRKGVSLAELNARRKIHLSKYQDKAKDHEVDLDGE